MKKIIFCDMDGTIINETSLLYAKDRMMIEKYRHAGNLFAFNTGRNLEEALHACKKHQLEYDYLVLNNGAHIVDDKHQEIFKRVINHDDGVAIIEHCLTYPDMWVNYFDGKRTLGYMNNKTYIMGEHDFIETSEFDFIKEYPKVKEFDIIALYQTNQQIDQVLIVQKYLQDNFAKVAHGTLNQHYLDITPSDCTKGTGLSNLLELLDGNFTSYALGDSYNDISMFEHADYGYTFHRVDEQIKQHSYQQVNYLSELIEKIL